MTAQLSVRPDLGSPQWTDVCSYAELMPERGSCVLVGGRAIAVFRTHSGEVHAVANVDPVARASVLSRGLVGTRGDIPTVASPLYKQVYDLRTGYCLDDDTLRIAVHGVRVVDGRVLVSAAEAG